METISVLLLLVNRQSSYLILVCLHSDYSSISLPVPIFPRLPHTVYMSILNEINVNAIILFHIRAKKSSCCRAIQFMSLVDCFHNRNQTLNRISMFWSKRKTLYKCTQKWWFENRHIISLGLFLFCYFTTTLHFYFYVLSLSPSHFPLGSAYKFVWDLREIGLRQR